MSTPLLLRLCCVAVAGVGLLTLTTSALAQPTADPAAATPTAPIPGGPPVGRSPHGDVIGGRGMAGRGVTVADSAPALPTDISSQGWLVADADSGDVLAARDPHGRYYPASTLKTLTFLTLYDRLDPATLVTATLEDASIEGTRVGIVEGGVYPVSLLFAAMMMQSANDAANALARTAGGIAQTVDLMNAQAMALQAYDTTAGSPSGLDVAGQSSSPYDLALFMKQIIDDPELLAVLQTRTAELPAVPPKYAGFQFQNQNVLLDSYPGDLAGKNGFTDAARHTYVGAAERDGRRLVVALMDGEQVPISMVEQATRLFDWGFGLPAGTPGVGTLVAALPPGGTPSAASRTTPSSPAERADSVTATPPAPVDGGDPPRLLFAGLGLASAALVFVVTGQRRRRR